MLWNLLHKFVRALVVLSFALLTVFIFILTWFGSGLYTEKVPANTKLAFWMEHAWSTVRPPSFEELKQRIETYGIDTLYFHVGPFDPSGRLPEDLLIHTRELNELSTENFAWMGQVRSAIELENPEVRAKIIEEAQRMLDAGFDGIHINIEPIRSHDEAFLLLVAELRKTLPNAKLSVAMDEWEPYWLGRAIEWISQVPHNSDWNTKHVQIVAAFVDQMVVMTYDTRFSDPLLYQWWVEEQSIRLSNILPKEVELFVGIPSYDEGASIDPTVENIETGLIGVEKARRNLRSRQPSITGVAVYSYWEMQDYEWDILKSYQEP